MARMGESLHEHAKRIFLEAVDLPTEDRDSFIAAQCDGRDELDAMVRDLINADEGAHADVFMGNPTLIGEHDEDLTGSIGTLTIGHDRTDMREIEIPKKIGPITLADELGHGATGVVYRGHDELLNRAVAVKFLRFMPIDDTVDTEAFCDGVRQACRLTHVGLTGIFAANDHDGIPYIIMEYIDGPSLRQALRRRGPFDARSVVTIARRMCEAVGALHDANIVHRDIKPGNIMLSRDGRIVVTDFGLACDRPWGTFGDRNERVSGTPAYMAPEMFEGIVSTRTDVFALGVTMYELLTGRLPFGASLDEIREAFQKDELEIDGGDHAEEVMEIIRRATRRNPVYRFKNAGRMMQALAALPIQDVSGIQLMNLTETQDGEAIDGTDPGDSTTGQYYETISRLAARHKSVRPIVETPEEDEPDESGAPRLRWPLPCRRCGRSLEGTPEDSTCEQCGLPVPESRDPRRMAMMDRSHLMRLMCATLVLRVNTVLMPLFLWLAGATAEGRLVGVGLGVIAAAANVLAAFEVSQRTNCSGRGNVFCLVSWTHLLLHLLTWILLVVAGILSFRGIQTGLLPVIIVMLSMYFFSLIAMATLASMIPSLDRQKVFSSKLGYDSWLLVVGLPTIIVFGFNVGMALADSVKESMPVEIRSLLVTICVVGFLAPWIGASMSLGSAHRAALAMLRIARSRDEVEGDSRGET